ncbi:MAG: hypothetical protein V3V15_05730 [Sphingorhabdus sp.]
MAGTKITGFHFLKSDIINRLDKPRGSTKFWTYLIVGLLIIGGLPIIMELYKYSPSGNNSDSIKLAVFTFFAATVGSSSLRLMLNDENSPIRMLGIFGLTLCAVITFSLVKNLGSIVGYWSIFACAITMLLSILWWWICNGDDPIFDEQFTDHAATGGDDIDRQLPGNLNEFEG